MKICGTCEYGHLSLDIFPCSECKKKSNWKAKKGGTQ